MSPKHATMSSVDLLQELNDFTTQVKTKTVPILGYAKLKKFAYNTNHYDIV